MDTFARLADIPKYARMVSFEEIASESNEFNLNLPRYIDNAEAEDLHDLEGHLRGGIPNRDVDGLNAYWEALPNLRNFLFESAGRPGFLQLSLELGEFRTAILEHSDFSDFRQEVDEHYSSWGDLAEPLLFAFGENDNPRELVESVSEALLDAFGPAPLLDVYDVYQHLMDLWTEFMQDDAYLISSLGWVKAVQPREIFQVKKKDGKPTWSEPHDYVLEKRRFKSDLLPAQILIKQYFSKEFSALCALDGQIAGLDQQLVDMQDQHGGEDGLLIEVMSEKQSISAKAIRERLKEIGVNPHYSDELEVLEKYLGMLQEQSATKRQRGKCQQDLDTKIDLKYPNLTETEIKKLVVEDKWLANMSACIQSEVESVSQTLTERIRQLAERYATPLPELTAEVANLSNRVEEHLRKMGVSWS